MEESFILISTLNDFIFCPYSIYLHNVYESTDESLFHATPQAQGRISHETVDENGAVKAMMLSTLSQSIQSDMG